MSESEHKSGTDHHEPSLREGDKVGRFLIRNFITAGGMGELYRAWDTDLNRYVAIKTLLATAGVYAMDPMFFTRFRTEAQAIANLEHDNVVRVLQFGEMEGNRPYIVMPFLEGEDLARRLDRARFNKRPLPVDEAVEIILGACRGVHACHLAGIVHRDLKPGNVFLTRDQERGRLVVKVLDFGVARPTRRDNQDSTLNGLVIGTPAYMAPEQAHALPADARSDQYSLGALLYAILTLHTPHDHAGVGIAPRAEAARARLRALGEGRPFPAPSSYAPGIPKPLEAAIMKALTPDPEGRFESVYEFSRALEPFASAEVRRYLTDYYRTPPMPIVIPQLTMPIGDAPSLAGVHPITVDPGRVAGAALGVPAQRSDPRSVEVALEDDSKKLTAGLRVGHVSGVTEVRRPPSELLRSAKATDPTVSLPVDEGAATEVRGPHSDIFPLASPNMGVDVPASPPITLASPPHLNVVAPGSTSSRDPSQAELGTPIVHRQQRAPLFLLVAAAVAIVVTMGGVFVLRHSRDKAPSTLIRPPAFLMPTAQPIAPKFPEMPAATPIAPKSPEKPLAAPAPPAKVDPTPAAASQVPSPVGSQPEATISSPPRRRSPPREPWWKRTRQTENGWRVATDPHGRVWTIDEKTGRPSIELSPDGMPILP